jgi:hypothetical protein
VEPHELLPIIPPMVQLTWVDGLGPTISPYFFTASLTWSRAMPGCTIAARPPGSTEMTSWQYLVQSMTTASLQHWPARLVPPPRDSTGAPSSRHTATASAPASALFGSTTPIGTWR